MKNLKNKILGLSLLISAASAQALVYERLGVTGIVVKVTAKDFDLNTGSQTVRIPMSLVTTKPVKGTIYTAEIKMDDFAQVQPVGSRSL